MSRDYCTPGPPFLYTGGEPGSGGMDCLHNHHHNHHHQLRQPPAVVSTTNATPVPFHYLISEQAKSFVVLQELQHEVGALLEFRDLVIETFPSLRTKMAAAAANNPSATSSVPAAASTPISSSSGTTAALMLLSSTSSNSNIPVAIRHRDWEPGIRVRRKLNVSGGKKSESTIQDSGFSTETSSKETHSSSAANSSNSSQNTDELWNLLDVIHRKGTRLKDEVEALQGTIANQSHFHEETDFQRYLFHGSADDLRQLRVERDQLLDRLAEMEAEVMASRAHTARMREDFEVLAATRVDLETQLRAMVDQRGAVNDRIGDLHAEFVTGSDRTKDGVQLVEGVVLDKVLGASVPKVKQTETCKVAAILQERNPLVLQKHLLTTTVRNQVLQEQLDSASKLEVGLATKLDKARVENDELKFQLKDKNIELEGTLALVRMLELRQQQQQQQKQPASSLTTSSVHSSSTIRSPDIIPLSDLTSSTGGSTLIHEQQRPLSRTEITTSSMKAMSPFPEPTTQQPLNNLDHSSSTESAHDQTESVRNAKSAETPRRKPSKIPLVKNPAPKPPNAATPSLRSRSGEPTPSNRHHTTSANSTHSWRLKTQHNNSHNNHNNPADHTVTNNSLNTSKSTGSLVSHTTRHHHHNLSTSTSSSILRSGGGNNPRDSLSGQTTAQSYKSVTSHKSACSSNGSSGRFRKTSPSVRRAATLRDTSTSNCSIGGGVMVTSDTSKVRHHKFSWRSWFTNGGQS